MANQQASDGVPEDDSPTVELLFLQGGAQWSGTTCGCGEFTCLDCNPSW